MPPRRTVERQRGPEEEHKPQAAKVRTFDRLKDTKAKIRTKKGHRRGGGWSGMVDGAHTVPEGEIYIVVESQRHGGDGPERFVRARTVHHVFSPVVALP